MTTPTTPYLDVDVLVCGGGSAGMTAAVAAARTGAATALVERYGFPGGISTQVLDTFYGFYTPGDAPERVVGGIPWEIASALLATGAAIERPNSYGAGTGITYDPTALKVLWERTALAAGVRLLYHAFVCGVVARGDRLHGVRVASKAGLLEIRARALVDATGDGDVAAWAGAPFEKAGASGEAQAMTTTFSMVNVDVDRARAVKQPELQRLMADAIDAGYDLPRREGSVHVTPLPGTMVTNMTRVAGLDPTDPEDLTRAEVEGRRQALEYARFLTDRVPVYGASAIGGVSTQIGIRETRRIHGQYRLTREDVLEARDAPDGIARCGAPIEVHSAGKGDTRWEYLPAGRTYAIPYRCLVPQQIDNLLVAGRCLSATYDAHASVRSMGQCMAMGQAAGTAAALAVRTGAKPHTLAPTLLRETLTKDGVIL